MIVFVEIVEGVEIVEKSTLISLVFTLIGVVMWAIP